MTDDSAARTVRGIPFAQTGRFGVVDLLLGVVLGAVTFYVAGLASSLLHVSDDAEWLSFWGVVVLVLSFGIGLLVGRRWPRVTTVAGVTLLSMAVIAFVTGWAYPVPEVSSWSDWSAVWAAGGSTRFVLLLGVVLVGSGAMGVRRHGRKRFGGAPQRS